MTNAKGWQFDIKSCGAYFHHDQHKNFRKTSDLSRLYAMIFNDPGNKKIQSLSASSSRFPEKTVSPAEIYTKTAGTFSL